MINLLIIKNCRKPDLLSNASAQRDGRPISEVAKTACAYMNSNWRDIRLQVKK